MSSVFWVARLFGVVICSFWFVLLRLVLPVASLGATT